MLPVFHLPEPSKHPRGSSSRGFLDKNPDVVGSIHSKRQMREKRKKAAVGLTDRGLKLSSGIFYWEYKGGPG